MANPCSGPICKRTCLPFRIMESIRSNGTMPPFLEPCSESVEGKYWVWMNRAISDCIDVHAVAKTLTTHHQIELQASISRLNQPTYHAYCFVGSTGSSTAWNNWNNRKPCSITIRHQLSITRPEGLEKNYTSRAFQECAHLHCSPKSILCQCFHM
jgi:hypothetical protein